MAKSCGGCHGIFSGEDVCPSYSYEGEKDRPRKERVMTMVIFRSSSVESCGGDRGVSSREEEVCPSSIIISSIMISIISIRNVVISIIMWAVPL